MTLWLWLVLVMVILVVVVVAIVAVVVVPVFLARMCRCLSAPGHAQKKRFGAIRGRKD